MNAHGTDTDNRCRWDGGSGHYEVWYLTGNHRDTETGYWIRYTLEAPLPGHGHPYAQLWFALFDARDPSRNIALNQRLPIAELATESEPFSVTIGDARLTPRTATGRVSGDIHEARWDLSWTPAAFTYKHLPGLMYLRGGLGETTVLSPNLDVAISGTIEVDGRTVTLRDEPGCQTHLWGKKHAFSWAWGHCNAFIESSGSGAGDRPGAALELLSVKLKRAGRLLPQMTLFTLYLDGEVYRFNQLRHTLVTRARYGGTRLTFSGASGRFRLEGEFSCRPEDMVVAPYSDPDGEPSFCCNTEVADLRVVLYERRGRQGFCERTRLLAPRRGHFEIGGRTRDPAITAQHVTVTKAT